ncbi:pyruvate formate-lyase-activating protein [Selenomonas sp. TAMA-11512]|uniref:pyruvate formate-lyase-activating protein n=1 Tax=Selenomonas sp. TAMA-11512 TaxID=3095337 RepID=UPI003087DD14|nr:pyruvate formate-lyase-activating protein [Selenomonas sp. TAMA-11512]
MSTEYADVTGRISSIESFGSVDGPGLRYIVFLAGCPFRCLYCHNPETWDPSGGKVQTAADTLRAALRYRPYWKDVGGITVSGGEPLMQLDFLEALFALAKQEKKPVNTCIDTSGALFTREGAFFEKLNRVLGNTDLLLLDLKHIDSKKHKELVGKPNEHVLDFARYLADIGKPVWIRHVLVPGYTDDAVSLQRLSREIASLGNVQRVDVLPYHGMARSKYQDLGIPYPLEDTSEPTADDVRRAKEILCVEDYQGYKSKA